MSLNTVKLENQLPTSCAGQHRAPSYQHCISWLLAGNSLFSKLMQYEASVMQCEQKPPFKNIP